MGLKERCNWEEILRYDNYTRTGLRMGLLETRIQIMDRHGWRWSGESPSIGEALWAVVQPVLLEIFVKPDCDGEQYHPPCRNS